MAFGCRLSEKCSETVLDMMGVQNCKPSTSPTLDKMSRVMMNNCDKNLSCRAWPFALGCIQYVEDQIFSPWFVGCAST